MSKRYPSYWCLLITLTVATVAHSGVAGPGFTYQGELQDGGAPATGNWDFQFEVFDSEVGGSPLAGSVSQTLVLEDGVFNTVLDFGDAPFDGGAVWLEVRARPTGGGGYTTLTPRQEITAAPYALHAQSVPAGSIGSNEIDPGEVQRRITIGCPPGEYMNSVGEDGTVTCAADMSSAEPFWAELPDERIQSERGVRIQPNPAVMFPFTVRHDSANDSPQIAITESQAGDLTRLNFYNDSDQTRAWTIGGGVSDALANDRLHFFNTGLSRGSFAPNLTVSSEEGGRVGINTGNPGAPLMVESGDHWSPASGNGLGDFHIGNGTIGLSIGVALGGGGAGTPRIWATGDNAIIMANPSTDVMTIGYQGNRVGIGHHLPQAQFHTAGSVRHDVLAHGQSGLRSVMVNEVGDLSASEVVTEYYSITAAEFRPSTEGTFTVEFGREVWMTDGSATELVAPIHLPHGAVIKQITTWVLDNDPDTTISAEVQFNDIDALGNGSFGSETTTMDSPDSQALVKIFAGFAVDNSSDAWYITVRPTPSWPVSEAVRLRAARVTYEITR